MTQGSDVASITKFLERPVLVAAGNLNNTADTVWAYAYNTTADYRNQFGANNWDRLKGAVGIRATLVFTVNVTASAFNQGILVLAYQHGADSLTSNEARHRWLPCVVNLPHVRMNIASSTMMQLEVPFVSQFEYIPVEVGNFTSCVGGVVSLTNMCGAKTVTNQDPARYTIYVSMKDIELIGALPYDTTTVILQSGLRDTRHTSSRAVTRASNSVRGVSQVSHEASEYGLLSGALADVSDVANAISTVPGLSTIGGTVDWFAEFASQTAKSLGFSKPLDETLIQRVNRYSYGLDGQVDVPTNALSLSTFQGNKVNIGPDLGMTDDNEMQFDYILTKYQHIFNGQLSTSAAVGDVVYGCPICPTAFWFREPTFAAAALKTNKPLKTSNAGTENAFLPSTLCYVADSFRFWRGSFKFRFSFAKTKLHGGRVQLTFIPFSQNTAINQPISSNTVVPSVSGVGPSATGYSYIFDLRDSDEFEFEVPYVFNVPYISTYRSIGDISMTVVAPLKSNVSVSSTVDFMVEVAALPGFEFAVPAPSIMAAVPETGTVSVSYQSGLSLAPAVEDISQQVIGERVTSVKQMIMMPDYFQQDVNNASVFTMHFDPWFKSNAPALTSPMSVTAQALWFSSRSSRFANLYAFARGATMAIVQKDVATNKVSCVLKYRGQVGGAATSTFSSFYDKANNYYSTVLAAETLESLRAKIPLYGSYARYSVSLSEAAFGNNSLIPNTSTWGSVAGTTIVPELTVRNTSGGTARIIVGRAAADDATLSRFVGPPPCIVFNSLATVSPVYGSTAANTF